MHYTPRNIDKFHISAYPMRTLEGVCHNRFRSFTKSSDVTSWGHEHVIKPMKPLPGAVQLPLSKLQGHMTKSNVLWYNTLFLDGLLQLSPSFELQTCFAIEKGKWKTIGCYRTSLVIHDRFSNRMELTFETAMSMYSIQGRVK